LKNLLHHSNIEIHFLIGQGVNHSSFLNKNVIIVGIVNEFFKKWRW